ncbi:hypothetical protein [Brachybacterium sp. AOP3-A1-3]|uniref:hypothetical protein n=1 Tax=Brachybacterium sp. AOP3-A1-3 TaxID=3457699 RepID=UPI00403458BB
MVDDDDDARGPARRHDPVRPEDRSDVFDAPDAPDAAAHDTTHRSTPLTALELRARAEMTAPAGVGRSGARHRAEGSESSTTFFTRLDDLPERAREELFGPSVQHVLYVYYAEGPTLVGAVLDPPVAVHAPSASALEARIRTYVAEHRGVVEADVQTFGRRVERDHALRILTAPGS